MAKAAQRFFDILEQIDKIPGYRIGLFTSILLLIISFLLKDIVPHDDLIFYGGEYGAVGAALAQGRGFSDPFSIGSGSTAWVAPLLPTIMGSIFYMTSLKVTSTYWILLLIKISSLGFGTGLIWSVLQRYNHGFAPICYFWMGILCYIYSMDIILLYHDEWLIFLVISLAFWAWVQRASFKGQIVLVVAFSAAALCNPILWGALFMVMLFLNRMVSNHNRESIKCFIKNKPLNFLSRNTFLIAVSISFFLIVGWTIRNWIQLGMFAPIKSNAGYEVFQAQITSRNGVPDFTTFSNHPIYFTSNDHGAYGALGEPGFIRTRRDMAIRSILSDPIDYCRRVAQRFKNAFLFTASPVNTAIVDSRIGSGDFRHLRSAGFVAYRNNQKIWIDLDDPNKDLINALPLLGLADPQLVKENWRLISEGYYWYSFSVIRIIGGCLTGGMPWVAFMIAILMRRRSELPPGTWWASIFLFFYLIPYVLISHYMRYQVPLLGMQAILLSAGTVALLTTLRRETVSAAHHED